jgi:hypothetical protein
MAGNLFIKWTAGDTGTRPIPSGSSWWQSPSIWINSPGNAEARSGQDNFIYVQPDRIGGGTDSSDVSIRAWVCNPTTAPGPGGNCIASAGGPGGLGKANIAATLPLSAQLINNWRPLDTDVAVNGGHLCIVANIWDANGDGTDLTTGPVDVVNNQHHAQLNIHLAMGMMGMSLRIPFWFPILEALPEADRGPGLIRIHAVAGADVLGQVTKEQLLRDPRVTLEHEDSTQPREVFNPYCLQEPPERTRLRQGGELILSGSDFKVHPSEAAPERAGLLFEDRVQQEIQVTPLSGAAEVRTFVCELSKDDFGGVHEFDIVHATAEGRVAGGMRVVVLNARPCY